MKHGEFVHPLVGRGGAPASSPVIDGPGRSRRELPGEEAAVAAVLPWNISQRWPYSATGFTGHTESAEGAAVLVNVGRQLCGEKYR
jgi:hypothetical protein